MSVTLLHDDERGRLHVDGNEAILTDKVSTGDPVALRLRSTNETKGKISVDTQVNGVWRELGFVGFKADERGRVDPAHRDALEVEFWSHIPGRDFEDPSYTRIFAIRHDGPVFYAGSGNSSGAPAMLRSPNGRMVLAAQDDDNLVLYVDGQPVRALHGVATEKVW